MKAEYHLHHVMKRVLTTLLTVLLTNILLAFNPPPLRPLLPLLDTTIMRMNLGLVPTGILEDFGETPVNLDAFNGVSTLCDTNYVNFRLFCPCAGINFRGCCFQTTDDLPLGSQGEYERPYNMDNKSIFTS